MLLKTNLLKHQEEAFEKLKKLTVGALFMEMGTGKTRTTLELIKYRLELKKIKNIIWFTPVSTKFNLEKEIKKHCDLGICNFNEKTNEESEFSIINIVGIESVSSSDRVKLACFKCLCNETMLVVDESSYIKNHRAKRSSFIETISKKLKYKLILNGTPTTNNVSDLYQQFKLLSPQILGYRSFHTFANNHLEYDKKIPGRIIASENVDFLSSKIAPYSYRIMKVDCLSLPEKIHKIIKGNLTNEQETWYERIKEELLFRAFEEEREFDILNLFNKLQQISSGFLIEDNSVRLFKNKKVELLEDLKDKLEGKTVIFFKFNAEKHFIKKIFKDIKFITGDISIKKRNKYIEEFENENQYIAINLSCGSYGLNLQVAENVIYYSNKFNFSEKLQSEDRVHRIGQLKNVKYYDICVSNIENRITESLSRKQNLLDLISEQLKNKNLEYLKKEL